MFLLFICQISSTPQRGHGGILLRYHWNVHPGAGWAVLNVIQFLTIIWNIGIFQHQLSFTRAVYGKVQFVSAIIINIQNTSGLMDHWRHVTKHKPTQQLQHVRKILRAPTLVLYPSFYKSVSGGITSLTYLTINHFICFQFI